MSNFNLTFNTREMLVLVMALESAKREELRSDEGEAMQTLRIAELVELRARLRAAKEG